MNLLKKERGYKLLFQKVFALNICYKVRCFFSSNEEVFSNIYKRNKWHSEEATDAEFNSGSGSDKQFSTPYIKMLKEFLQDNHIECIVDLGCGDFRVGSLLLSELDDSQKYIGIDVVPSLISHHNEHYGSSNSVFYCKDIVTGELPYKNGALYLVRQVFQHLSNKEIAIVMDKIPRTAKLIVTEHQQIDTNKVFPNRDKVRGADIRLSKKSAVFLDAPPFSYKTRLLSQVDINSTECIRSFEVFVD